MEKQKRTKPMISFLFFLNEFHRTLTLCMKDKRKGLFLSVIKNRRYA